MKVLPDADKLVRTKKCKAVKFPYKVFNPIQSATFPYFEKSGNLFVAAHTATGKTDVATAVFAHQLKKGRKCLYISPTRALSDEKYKYWGELFDDKDVVIHTGDYTNKKGSVFDGDLIIMTTELFDSQSRKKNQRKEIRGVGCVAFDEVHMLKEENRGHRVETSIVRLCDIQPKVRLVFLSATISNGKEIARWAENITGRTTYFYSSDWRPVRLDRHYLSYSSPSNLMAQAYEIVDKNRKEKIILFVHSKNFGYKLKEHLLRLGVRTEFHNASLDKARRLALEKAFMDDGAGGLRVLISTSTLGQGVNLPASVVVICGLTRGRELVKPSEVEQEIGRCGRVFAAKLEAYVKKNKKRPRDEVEVEYRRKIKGDVYILVPSSSKKQISYVDWLNDPKNFRVGSVLPVLETMCFHVVAEMYRGNVKRVGELEEWYEKTFAHYTGKSFDFSAVLERLKSVGAIEISGPELKLRNLGKVASRYYYNPLDVYAILLNLHRAFKFQKMDDACLCWALSDIPANRGIISRDEKVAIGWYVDEVKACGLSHFNEGSEKIGAVLCARVTGKRVKTLSSMNMMVGYDAGRLTNMVDALVDSCTRWDKPKLFRKFGARVAYGVSWNEAEFCLLDGVGKVTAKLLVSLGYSNFGEVLADKANAINNVPGLKSVIKRNTKK